MYSLWRIFDNRKYLGHTADFPCICSYDICICISYLTRLRHSGRLNKLGADTYNPHFGTSVDGNLDIARASKQAERRRSDSIPGSHHNIASPGLFPCISHIRLRDGSRHRNSLPHTAVSGECNIFNLDYGISPIGHYSACHDSNRLSRLESHLTHNTCSNPVYNFELYWCFGRRGIKIGSAHCKPIHCSVVERRNINIAFQINRSHAVERIKQPHRFYGHLELRPGRKLNHPPARLLDAYHVMFHNPPPCKTFCCIETDYRKHHVRANRFLLR